MIYYSHINEDNRVERKLQQAGKFAIVVAICGSGERVLSLLDNSACKRMIVVDFNEEAIYLLQLKLTALQKLGVDDYLDFVGHNQLAEKNRVALYQSFKSLLPIAAQRFWDKHISSIQKGILHIGHFEKFLQRVRPLTNFYLGKKFQNIFKKGEQKNGFPSFRWTILKNFFSHKLVYRLAGNKDVAFVGADAETKIIPAALDSVIKNRNASSSFMMHLIFKGGVTEMQDCDRPPSLQKEVLSIIKERLAIKEIIVEYRTSDLLSFAKQEANNLMPPVFYSLSDILSFAGFAYLDKVMKCISGKGNLIVARSFLRNRLTSNQLNALATYGNVNLHSDEESTGMYQVFSINGNKSE